MQKLALGALVMTALLIGAFAFVSRPLSEKPVPSASAETTPHSTSSPKEEDSVAAPSTFSFEYAPTEVNVPDAEVSTANETKQKSSQIK